MGANGSQEEAELTETGLQRKRRGCRDFYRSPGEKSSKALRVSRPVKHLSDLSV